MTTFEHGTMIPVARSHIENGVMNTKDNPVSLAIREYLGNPNDIVVDVRTEEQLIRFYQRGQFGSVSQLSTNAQLEKWVSDYMAGKEAEPMLMSINVDDKYTWINIDKSHEREVFMALEHRIYLKGKLKSAQEALCSVILALGGIESVDGDIASLEYIPNFMQDNLNELNYAFKALKYAKSEFETAIENGKRYGIQSIDELAEKIRKDSCENE